MEKKLYDLVIDEDLRKVAPPLAAYELDMLREDILEYGCKFPLIVWGETIVDGHNRYAICREHEIPFAIETMDFSDKTEAKMWIIRNQLGRRNLNDFQRCEMVLPLEDELKEAAHKRKQEGGCLTENGGRQKFAQVPRTRDVLAGIAGISHTTLEKVKVIILGADEETIAKLRSGEMKIHTAYVQLRRKERPVTHAPQTYDAGMAAGSEQRDESPVITQEADVTSGETVTGNSGMGNSEVRNPDTDSPKTETDYEPLVHLDHPIIVPDMRDKPKREPRPFQSVRDQVWFSMENMVRNLEIAMNWLRDEDKDKVPELLELLDAGFDRAEALITGQEDE